MPSALKELIRKLSGSREAELPSTQSFPSLDLEQIYRELNLAERGKENGSRNRPAAAGDLEDTAESDILAEIERRARKAGEEFRSQLELYEGRIRNAANQTGHEAKINAAGQGALADYDVQVNHDLDFLHDALREVQEREQEFSAFRKTHQLERPPHNIPARKRIIRGLWLVVFVVLESILNSNFFAKGSETGLFGGFIQAFVLSLLNVGGAVIFALYGLPLLSHVRRAVKVLGIFCILVYGGWAIGINMLIGHYRDLFILKGGVGVVSVAEVASRFKIAPFDFAEAQSFILILLGIGLSIVSLIDASGMNDPYPGYRSIGERRRVASATYEENKTQCFEELTRLRDTAINEMLDIIELIRSAEYEYRRAVDGRSRLHENYYAYLKYLGDSYIRLLQRYREENIRSRSEPAPTRFSSRPSLPPFLTEPQKSPLPIISREIKSKGVELLEYFAKEINQKFKDAVEKYKSISSLANPEAKTIDVK